MSGLYSHNYSPARAPSPHIRATPEVDSGQYLTELLEERQKLAPFVQILPVCSRLLNQEILRVSGMISSQQGLSDFGRLQRGSLSPMASDILPNNAGMDFTGWSGVTQECLFQRLGSHSQGLNTEWQVAASSPGSYIIKKILRLDIPINNYPNFNFVGRLLGPRGNSLKRVEASTGCRVYIRGKGSIKDPEKEESLRGKPGYEHLNDPLHILIEAELPSSIIDIRLRQAQEIIEEVLKPVDESQDIYKRQQLRELAMLNSSYREESPRPIGSVSPFTSNGMKRAKTGQ
ncbi:hypothetical protein K2173_023648 [Erythroxylum novogranatense]|uniref:K Homology domain-containing protein n=1 Tax=Erythroxylum novogranatense TaxID=1862640 RepID=A0AAV8TRK2_9ROSI|nr:hypothetical protein K2173_023648 [Erythroxylum novogranatense]